MELKNRINITLSNKQLDALKEIAAEKETSIVDVIRSAVDLAVRLRELQDESPDFMLYTRKDGVDRPILLI